MTLHLRNVPPRAARVLAAVLLAVGMSVVLAPGVASADENESDFSVTVPRTVDPGSSPSPSPSPSAPPAPQESGKPTGGGSGPGGSGGSGGPVGAPPAGTTSTPACTPAEPAVPSSPATTGEEASVDKDVYLVGDTVTATTAGFGAGEQVQLVLFSEPLLVGTFTAGADGSVRAEFPVADTVLPGTHTLQFTGWCKRIALADVLVGSDAGSDGASATSAIPPWAWWVGGGLGVAALLAAGWQVVRVMRETAAPVEAVTP